MAAKKSEKAPRPRTDAQIAAEQRREENGLGVIKVRHSAASAAAVAKVMKHMKINGPEAMRLGVVELARKLK